MELLTPIWFVIIGFCIIMYVMLDGFDLGVGILFPFFLDKDDRDIMMSSILPVWDGNQTWLVLGFASLYGAFPLAFSLLLPALYLPLFGMVIALLFRGITLEFRLKAIDAQSIWDFLFFISSTLVALIQGLVLGTFVKGFTMGPNKLLNYDLFTPFNLTCSIAVLFGYALLGSTWVIGKTSGRLQEKMFQIAKICLAVVSVALVIISIWSPFVDPHIWNIWFNPNTIFKLAILPFVTACLIGFFIYSLYKKKENILFLLTIGIFMCSYAGFGISTWPYLIPRIITIWDAAAPAYSQSFMLVGALILLPVLIGYTAYSYYIFRGKIKEVIGY